MSHRFGLPRNLNILTRSSTPAIIPIVLPKSGNNKPKSLQKTKRTFSPNVTKMDWTLNVLGGVVPVDEPGPLPKLRKMKMQMRRVKDVEKAGGIEGYLLSRRPKDLTPYGAYLRAELFDSLYLIKKSIERDDRLKRQLEHEKANLLRSGSKPVNVTQRIGGEESSETPLLEGH
ncbi:hypothetical protein IAT38_004033 [Cryptococcus sp. DSM 104549]